MIFFSSIGALRGHGTTSRVCELDFEPVMMAGSDPDRSDTFLFHIMHIMVIEKKPPIRHFLSPSSITHLPFLKKRNNHLFEVMYLRG